MAPAATTTHAIPIPAAAPPDTWLAPALSPTPGVDVSDAELLLVAVGSGVGAPIEEKVELSSRVVGCELCGVSALLVRTEAVVVGDDVVVVLCGCRWVCSV